MNESQLFHLFGAYFAASMLMALFREVWFYYYIKPMRKANRFSIWLSKYDRLITVILVALGAIAIELYQGLTAYPLDTALDLLADALGVVIYFATHRD